MLSKLNNFALSSKSWLLLAFSALAFELCALFFQYGMGLEPCIMCIYQRVAILGILIAGIIGAVGVNSPVARFIGFIVWLVSSIKGLQIAIEHADMQLPENAFFYTCDLVPNFPTWLELHVWFPMFFEATGDCGDIAWSFLGYSMPQWMTVIFSVYFILFAIFFGSRIVSLLTKK